MSNVNKALSTHTNVLRDDAARELRLLISRLESIVADVEAGQNLGWHDNGFNSATANAALIRYCATEQARSLAEAAGQRANG